MMVPAAGPEGQYPFGVVDLTFEMGHFMADFGGPHTHFWPSVVLRAELRRHRTYVASGHVHKTPIGPLGREGARGISKWNWLVRLSRLLAVRGSA